MKIEVENISKRFGRQQIIKNFTYSFLQNEMYVIQGANGSGKSTLLKMLSGFLSFDKGSIIYYNGVNVIQRDHLIQLIAYAAPYISSPEDLTITETIRFQQNFKTLSVSEAELLTILELPGDKKLLELSSGMKQRLQLGLAFYSTSSLLLLDEPTSFFDKAWKKKYQDWITATKGLKTVILCSNEEEEYAQFNRTVHLK
jgi:ABC-type multidrug transport system ATPase subunit